jgi:non-ribosomal peptide synthetase component E (peptide arylation enzyme)
VVGSCETGLEKGRGLTHSDSVISHHQRTILTYDALDRDSNRLARGLQKLGVRKGDRVAVSLGNNVEFATVWDSSVVGAAMRANLSEGG